jgi:hypothetical protein
MGGVMGCVIAVIGNDGADKASLPTQLTIDGSKSVLRKGSEFSMGGYAAREYEVMKETIIVVSVAKCSSGIVSLVWVPTDSRINAKKWTDRVAGGEIHILGQWLCKEMDGDLVSPALEKDKSPLAGEVRDAWPWRLPLEGEIGDPKNGIPASPFTGPLFVGVSLA